MNQQSLRSNINSYKNFSNKNNSQNSLMMRKLACEEIPQILDVIYSQFILEFYHGADSQIAHHFKMDQNDPKRRHSKET